MRLTDGDIVAGRRISGIALGMSRAELIGIIGSDYFTVHLPICEKICIENAHVWITDGLVTQITVFGSFGGLFMGCIGLGHSMSDVLQHIGQYTQEFDTYILPEHPGICFELTDIDDWDELRAPIEFISVFQ